MTEWRPKLAFEMGKGNGKEKHEWRQVQLTWAMLPHFVASRQSCVHLSPSSGRTYQMNARQTPPAPISFVHLCVTPINLFYLAPRHTGHARPSVAQCVLSLSPQ